jgi:hypothetical protein
MPARAEERGDDRGNDRCVQAVFRRQPGDRRERDALRQHDDRADAAGHGVGAQRHAIDARPPLQEREHARERKAHARL